MDAEDRCQYTKMAYFIGKKEVSENNLLHSVTKEEIEDALKKGFIKKINSNGITKYYLTQLGKELF